MAGDAPTRGTQFDVCRATAHPAIRLRSARLAQYRNHHGFPFVQDPLVIPTPFPTTLLRFPASPTILCASFPPLRAYVHLVSPPQTGPLNREISKNAFNFPLSSVVSPLLVIRLTGDRPFPLVFHANDITSAIEYLLKLLYRYRVIDLASSVSLSLSLSFSLSFYTGIFKFDIRSLSAPLQRVSL